MTWVSGLISIQNFDTFVSVRDKICSCFPVEKEGCCNKGSQLSLLSSCAFIYHWTAIFSAEWNRCRPLIGLVCGQLMMVWSICCLPCRHLSVSQWSSGNMPDCGVRGPRFESHRRQLCLSRQPLRYTALGTGCTPLLQCLGQLSLPSEGR